MAKVRQGPAYLIDLGAVPLQQERKLTLMVSNLAVDPRLITIRVVGDGIDARFEGAAWSTVVGGTKDAKLQVTVSSDALSMQHGASDLDQPLGQIFGMAGQKEVFAISFIRSIKPETVDVRADSPALPSGSGAASSPQYELCIDGSQIPQGYELVQDSLQYSLSGDRACNAWSTCAWSVRQKDKQCFKFSMQGHSESFFDRAGVRTSAGHLVGKAKLVEGNPVLRAGLTSIQDLDCVIGRWHEGQAPANPSSEWDFAVRGLAIMITKPTDGSAGSFEEVNGLLKGRIDWKTSEVASIVGMPIQVRAVRSTETALTPQSCNEIRTNSPLWFTRK